MKVIDNFLSTQDFKLIQHFFISNKISWHMCNSITGYTHGQDHYQFVHEFFNLDNPFKSDYSEYIQPLLDKLDARYLLRLKANLRPRTAQPVLSDYHVDMKLNQQTAIFYLNTNNGYTKFQDNTLQNVQSVENRLLTFDGGLKHCGCSCTDENYRILLNINYIPSRILT